MGTLTLSSAVPVNLKDAKVGQIFRDCKLCRLISVKGKDKIYKRYQLSTV